MLVIYILLIALELQDLSFPLAVVSSGVHPSPLESIVESIPSRATVQRPYDDLQKAINSTKLGDTRAVLSLASNFSADMHYDCFLGSEMNASYTDGTTVDLYVDMTDRFVGFRLQEKMVRAFKVSSCLEESSVQNR